MWSPMPDGEGRHLSGFTASTSAIQVKMTALYNQCGPNGGDTELRGVLQPYRRGLGSTLAPPVRARYRKVVGVTGLSYVDIMNRAGNCFYANARGIQEDLTRLFSHDIAFATSEGDDKLRTAIEVARDAVVLALDFDSAIPDDGVFLPQCNKDPLCRRPNEHASKCLKQWFGSCRRPDFANKMHPPGPTAEGRPLRTAAQNCSRLALLVRMQKEHNFSGDLLRSMCDRLVLNRREVQWVDDLVVVEQAYKRETVSKFNFLAAVLDCATYPRPLNPQ